MFLYDFLKITQKVKKTLCFFDFLNPKSQKKSLNKVKKTKNIKVFLCFSMILKSKMHIGWLAGWLDGCLAGWLAGWVSGWLSGWLDVGQSARCLDWLAG